MTPREPREAWPCLAWVPATVPPHPPDPTAPALDAPPVRRGGGSA